MKDTWHLNNSQNDLGQPKIMKNEFHFFFFQNVRRGLFQGIIQTVSIITDDII